MCKYSPFADYEILEIDLHNLDVDEARKVLYSTINTAPKQIREIIVIHGYHRGNKLQHLVWYELKPKRKVKIIKSENPGMTYLDFIN